MFLTKIFRFFKFNKEIKRPKSFDFSKDLVKITNYGGQIVYINKKILVDRNTKAIFRCKDKITDVFSEGNHYLNPSTLPNTYTRLRLNKQLEKGKTVMYQTAPVMFDEINDPGNLGTLIRTSAALGYDGVILSKNSCDIYNDKTVRASQGSIFKTKIVYDDLNKVIPYLKEQGYKLIGTSLKKAENLNEANPTNKFVICLGNEARGMSEEVLNLMDKNVKLTMHNDVESLNVMVAGSIIMYELKK